MKTAKKYIKLKDFHPSKAKGIVVDQKVFNVVKKCLEATEKGKVESFSPEVSLERLRAVARAVKEHRLKVEQGAATAAAAESAQAAARAAAEAESYFER